MNLHRAFLLPGSDQSHLPPEPSMQNFFSIALGFTAHDAVPLVPSIVEPSEPSEPSDKLVLY